MNVTVFKVNQKITKTSDAIAANETIEKVESKNILFQSFGISTQIEIVFDYDSLYQIEVAKIEGAELRTLDEVNNEQIAYSITINPQGIV